MDAETRSETSDQERTNIQLINTTRTQRENFNFDVRICGKAYNNVQDLKAHRTRMKHHEEKRTKMTATTTVDAILQKRNATQDLLPKVQWEDKESDNT